MSQSESSDRVAEQRRKLPDEPGVYIFRNAAGRVIYVGKANSVRKRVASHFSSPSTAGGDEMVAAIDSIESVVVHNETEALLTEQSFIKQYRPRFNVRLRDDKSYPYIGIALDEDYPRVYFTRERHRSERVYFGPYSNAKRVRATLDLLSKVFMFRSCEGAEPGRRSGSPCLDYFIKRCEAPCVAYITRDEYRVSIDGLIDFLGGKRKESERAIERRMQEASEAQEYEKAAIERNRLKAIRSLQEGQSVSSGSLGTLDAIAVALDDEEVNAQVFQVRDGALVDRQSFYLRNLRRASETEVLEEFLAQYYTSSVAIPPLVVFPGRLSVAGSIEELLGERRRARVEVRGAERGEKRRIVELAERNARLALSQEKLRIERSREQRADALEELRDALSLETLPVRVECFDISNLGGTHTTASMVVFEGGAPKKSDYRRFTIHSVNGIDDFASMSEVLGRRLSQWERQRELSPYDEARDDSFAALPNLIVIDGGKGQLSRGVAALRPFRDRGVAVISLAKRIEEVFIPGRSGPVLIDHDRPALQLLQRVRDEAHRFAITHHRARRGKAMTKSVLDGLSGVGPARKRALIDAFGSPDAVLAASREELESVPGIPGKLARELYAQFNKTGH